MVCGGDVVLDIGIAQESLIAPDTIFALKTNINGIVLASIPIWPQSHQRKLDRQCTSTAQQSSQ